MVISPFHGKPVATDYGNEELSLKPQTPAGMRLESSTKDGPVFAFFGKAFEKDLYADAVREQLRQGTQSAALGQAPVAFGPGNTPSPQNAPAGTPTDTTMPPPPLDEYPASKQPLNEKPDAKGRKD